jgi:mono/diheme cytochrome c family protein
MRLKSRLLWLVPILALAVGCTPPDRPPEPIGAGQADRPAQQDAVERGRYLVTIAACHDCHTPKTFTGPEPEVDMSRELSGHPADEALPEIPGGLIGPDRWGAITNNHLTAWVGPWGMSFARNLTPDMATGIGSWTEDMFIKTIREGRHQGEGRPLLPPMPWPMYKEMTDDDLKAVFAYLRSVPPIQNAVPDPVPPEKLTQ